MSQLVSLPRPALPALQPLHVAAWIELETHTTSKRAHADTR